MWNVWEETIKLNPHVSRGCPLFDTLLALVLTPAEWRAAVVSHYSSLYRIARSWIKKEEIGETIIILNRAEQYIQLRSSYLYGKADALTCYSERSQTHRCPGHQWLCSSHEPWHHSFSPQWRHWFFPQSNWRAAHKWPVRSTYRKLVHEET